MSDPRAKLHGGLVLIRPLSFLNLRKRRNNIDMPKSERLLTWDYLQSTNMTIVNIITTTRGAMKVIK